VVFAELLITSKHYMRGVTAIDGDWMLDTPGNVFKKATQQHHQQQPQQQQQNTPGGSLVLKRAHATASNKAAFTAESGGNVKSNSTTSNYPNNGKNARPASGTGGATPHFGASNFAQNIHNN
jgi:hypothetical protein